MNCKKHKSTQQHYTLVNVDGKPTKQEICGGCYEEAQNQKKHQLDVLSKAKFCKCGNPMQKTFVDTNGVITVEEICQVCYTAKHKEDLFREFTLFLSLFD